MKLQVLNVKCFRRHLGVMERFTYFKDDNPMDSPVESILQVGRDILCCVSEQDLIVEFRCSS